MMVKRKTVRDEEQPRTKRRKADSVEDSIKYDAVSGNLKMPGADVRYFPETLVFLLHSIKELFNQLQGTIQHSKFTCKQSRSIAAYANEDMTIRYSGHEVEIHTTYPSILRTIQDKVEEALGEKFNHVMLNRYQSGDEYIGRHRDTKQNKVIASLSLGAERTFIFTPGKKLMEQGASTKRFKLENGSLLVMQGNTQSNWTHEIPKEPKIKGGRISLTFRQIQEA